jgi:hypothetical protein
VLAPVLHDALVGEVHKVVLPDKGVLDELTGPERLDDLDHLQVLDGQVPEEFFFLLKI